METPSLEAYDASKPIWDIHFDSRPILTDISIVIPTLGRDILEKCLYWIARGKAWPGCLIIINQGQPDKVEAWLMYLRSIGIQSKQICSNQRGRSAGLNRGLEQVDTRFAAITDDDCFVAADWLEQMVAGLRAASDRIVTGRVEGLGEEMIVVVTSPTPAVYHRPRLKFDSMSGGNMGVALDVIRKVGLFDEDPVLRTAEDAEFSYRALKKGVSIVYDPRVVLWHVGWRDSANRIEQYRHYALSHGGFYGKYLRRGDWFIFARAGAHFLRSLRRWITGRIKGNRDMALLGQAYFLYLPRGIMAGLKSTSRADALNR